MNNLIAQLYNPEFTDIVVIEDLLFCRADSGLEPQAELCYFRTVPLFYLADLNAEGQYWYDKICNILNVETLKERAYIEIPFVARIGHGFPKYDDYAVYMGWPMLKFIKQGILVEAMFRQQYLPHKVATIGDKVGKSLAERLFPHLVKEGRIYRE